MHSLLQRQFRKYIPEHLKESTDLRGFLDAVEKSYEHYDEKLSMIQRATAISSEELFNANQEITKEAKRQQHIIASLEEAMNSLNSNFDEDDKLKYQKTKHFNAEKLAQHIKNLAVQISEITTEKNILFKDLEAQNQSLNNYVQMVSHDLKSPIRNINALISWIKEEEIDHFSESSVLHCERVFENLTKMDNLINGILQHATIGAQMGTKKNINLKELLVEIQTQIEYPNHITFDISDELPTIYAERNWIEQLFKHLINNAITATKQMSKGIIKIQGEDIDAFWKFSVSDNGKGIPKQHQGSIFEMFHKLDNDATSAGVGLTLAHKIVALYEGEIWLESEKEKGATFYFTLKK